MATNSQLAQLPLPITLQKRRLIKLTPLEQRSTLALRRSSLVVLAPQILLNTLVRRLRLLAQEAQVIVVTHLAQVAVWADHHLVVRKSEGGLVSISDVIPLDAEERSVEIARMLSGQEESATAREHARELLEMVQESVIS